MTNNLIWNDKRLKKTKVLFTLCSFIFSNNSDAQVIWANFLSKKVARWNHSYLKYAVDNWYYFVLYSQQLNHYFIYSLCPQTWNGLVVDPLKLDLAHNNRGSQAWTALTEYWLLSDWLLNWRQRCNLCFIAAKSREDSAESRCCRGGCSERHTVAGLSDCLGKKLDDSSTYHALTGWLVWLVD